MEGKALTNGEHIDILRTMLSGLSLHAKESEEVNKISFIFLRNAFKFSWMITERR